MIPPEVTLVRLALERLEPARSVPASDSEVRFAWLRLAPGPMK